MMWPTPIRWRGVRDRRINFCHVGSRKRSMMKIEMAVDMRLETRNVPAGILMEPKCLSMVRAWTVERLLTMAMVMLRRIPVDHSGMILITFLRSSTSSTVHNFHDFE
ncbi:hypothetical protein TorRG33x02_273500 [Trema orientale]|uniref:Uncharacterized protein n=1 Tax=Trema orientale TaxID=63057 RepID=A0A2P5CTF3_TREOI|nr:hypothetical protein TorRG33x02_273500 [Trema orientale]